MSRSERFRAKAAEYKHLAEQAVAPSAVPELNNRERAFTDLANNEEWLANNFDKTVHPNVDDQRCEDSVLPENGDQVLRNLGAAVIMQWNTLPTKLQKELFDNACSIGELLQPDELKRQIALFLHNHKDDGGMPRAGAT